MPRTSGHGRATRVLSILHEVARDAVSRLGRRAITAMRPIRWYWILSLFAAGCVPAGAEIGGTSGGQSVLITPDMVPDASYRPKPGDRALLYAIEGGNLLERL